MEPKWGWTFFVADEEPSHRPIRKPVVDSESQNDLVGVDSQKGPRSGLKRIHEFNNCSTSTGAGLSVFVDHKTRRQCFGRKFIVNSSERTSKEVIIGVCNSFKPLERAVTQGTNIGA